ncbi:MAG: glutamate synthase subunit beta [Ignavibacteria bacterium]|nr:glutamate synthase subunit beta [Ignavibacteria bacterium]
MGKPTGFMEFERAVLKKEQPEERVKHFKEFDSVFTREETKIQGARCMDCGIPFCHGDTGCPVKNYIPEWNDLIYHGHWKEALDNLHTTNNFPEFTGRLCPAPCESACTLGINEKPVSIKAIERTIIEKGFKDGNVKPRMPHVLSGKSVAIVGSGPAGLAAAQQLTRAGHSVTVFEKNERPGGLLRYGIPDFKMEKSILDRRLQQMVTEGVQFKTKVNIGVDIPANELIEKYDAVVLAGGSERPRDIQLPGRELSGVYFAMEFLTLQNKINADEKVEKVISAIGKNVIVLGGGDTGSDCVGTANRQGAKSVTQLEIMPMPPEERPYNTPWPYWPLIMRTSTSHEEGVVRRWSVNTKEFKGNEKGELTSLVCTEVNFEDGKFIDVPGTEFELPAELVLIAAGFVHPEKKGLIDELVSLGMELDQRGNVKAEFGNDDDYNYSRDNIRRAHSTSLEKVFACGDMRRGQSLVVWAIAEGRKCAASVHKYLTEVYSEETKS